MLTGPVDTDRAIDVGKTREAEDCSPTDVTSARANTRVRGRATISSHTVIATPL